jgi:hypothetical protein
MADQMYWRAGGTAASAGASGLVSEVELPTFEAEFRVRMDFGRFARGQECTNEESRTPYMVIKVPNEPPREVAIHELARWLCERPEFKTSTAPRCDMEAKFAELFCKLLERGGKALETPPVGTPITTPVGTPITTPPGGPPHITPPGHGLVPLSPGAIQFISEITGEMRAVQGQLDEQIGKTVEIWANRLTAFSNASSGGAPEKEEELVDGVKFSPSLGSQRSSSRKKL